MQSSITKFVSDSSASLNEQIINATIITAAYAVEHNISFNTTSHIPKLLSKQCPDSEIAKKNKFGSNKVYCYR